MEARLLHYSGRALLITPPTAPSPSSAPAAAPGFAGALPAAEHDDSAVPVSFNTNAIVLLAFLICGLVAAVALHVVLQCALRVTRRACYHGAGAGAMRQEPRRAAAAGVGEGGGRARRVGGGGGRNLAAALSTTMPCVAYTGGLELAGSSPSECAICLAEFARGDQVRVLPRCNHGFHPHCIDRWLGARPTCPTCRQVPFADEPVAAPGLAAGTAPVVPMVRGIVITSH